MMSEAPVEHIRQPGFLSKAVVTAKSHRLADNRRSLNSSQLSLPLYLLLKKTPEHKVLTRVLLFLSSKETSRMRVTDALQSNSCSSFNCRESLTFLTYIISSVSIAPCAPVLLTATRNASLASQAVISVQRRSSGRNDSSRGRRRR